MLHFRVTKYEPSRRNELGNFPHDDWTSFCDIGKLRGGSVLSREGYERVEAAYVQAALAFMQEAGAAALFARAVENHGDSPSAPAENSEFSLPDLPAVIRGVLRNEFWCRLEGARTYVHFGYDYYMYVGVPDPCESAAATAHGAGLFVEPWIAPYDGDAP